MLLNPRSKAIIHELLDDEIILADLDAGIYFSIRESGIPVWQLLVAGYSFEETVALFRKKYQIDPSQQLASFVDLLLKEQLLIEIYRPQDGFVNLDSARQSIIGSHCEHHSRVEKGEQQNRLGKAAASPNSHNLTERGINESLKEPIESILWPDSFTPPVFEKYEEMKNLLMLDPIHEVDEQGWPVKKGSDAPATV